MLLFNENLNDIPAGDRIVTVVARLARPRLVVLENVLADSECDAVIERASAKLEPSKTIRSTGGQEVNPSRTSSGTYFLRGEWPMLDEIDARISMLTGRPVETTESMQILRYGIGEKYSPHFDYFNPNESAFIENSAVGGNRIATMLLYLNTPTYGGATEFPDAGFRLTARRGSAVYFEYPTPDPSGGSLHGGATVMGGEKWVMTKWFRERALSG